MQETTKLLETALENEAKLFLKMISELENEELFDFINRVAVLKPKNTSSACPATENILHVAQNVMHLTFAADNFHVT